MKVERYLSTVVQSPHLVRASTSGARKASNRIEAKQALHLGSFAFYAMTWWSFVRDIIMVACEPDCFNMGPLSVTHSTNSI